MNARDGFAMWLTGLMADTCLDGNIAETMEALDEAFADYAHELAEKIRSDVAATGDWACCEAARKSAADLIDPEVP
ncbi:hypothetical protein ACWC0A_30595 [Streptomyces scopuliridis]